MKRASSDETINVIEQEKKKSKLSLPKKQPKIATEEMNDGDDEALSTACEIVEEGTLKPSMEEEMATFERAYKKLDKKLKKPRGQKRKLEALYSNLERTEKRIKMAADECLADCEKKLKDTKSRLETYQDYQEPTINELLSKFKKKRQA